MKNLTGKLKAKDENLNYTQRQLDEANKNIVNIDHHINELEQTLNRTKNELNSVNNAHLKERNGRLESEKNNEKLEILLKERNNEVKRLNLENDNARITNEKLNADKARLLADVERYKNHIVVLTEQNQKVSFAFNLIKFLVRRRT